MLTTEERQEAKLRRMLHGFSQCKGGGWRISMAKWKPLVPEIATWSLAALGIAILTFLVPQKAALWFGLGFGAIQTMQLMDTENPRAGSGPGDTRQEGGKKLNRNMMLTLMCAATLNAGWFGFHPQTGASLGHTATQIINDAVASAGGTPWYGLDCTAEAVWIPKKAGVTTLLPYDASAVTFNSAIHMLREGGNTSIDQWDINAYGADGGLSHIGIQAALDAAAASSGTNGTRTIYVGPGRFGCSQPVWVKSQGIVILGTDQGYNSAGYSPSRIDISHACGPAIYVQGDLAAAAMTTSLATGAGQAFVSDLNTHWFNLRDSSTLDINGIAQFTCRLYLTSTDTANPNSPLGICTSHGAWLPSDTPTTCFYLIRNTVSAGAATARGFLTLSGGTVLLDCTTNIVDGTTHVLEFNYDGSTVRFFVDGNLEASAAGSGTLVQGLGEEVTTGYSPAFAPERGSFLNGLLYTGDSLEIADVARNTVAYAKPTAKFAKDSHTRILLNGVATMGALVQVDTMNGIGWLHQRNSAIPGNVSGFRMQGVTITSPQSPCQGVLMAGNVMDWAMSDVSILYCREGLRATNGQFYHNTMDRPFVNAGASTARFGLVFNVLAGISNINNGWLQGPQVLFCSDAAVTTIRETYFQQDTRTVFGALLTNTGAGSSNSYIFDNPGFNTEAGVSSAYRAAIGLSGNLTQIIGRGGNLETGNNAPHIIADSIGGGEWIGGDFRKLGSPPAVMHVQGAAPVRPLVFRHCPQTFGWQRWADVDGAAAVDLPGTLTVASTATPDFDASFSSNFDITLSVAATAPTLSAITHGQTLNFTITQDGQGSHGFTWPANVIGGMTIASTPYSRSLQSFRVEHGFAIALSTGQTYTSVQMQLPGLVEWHDTSQLAGYSDGQGVTSATDASGNGNTMTGGATAPIFKTAQANGLPVLRFNGHTDGTGSKLFHGSNLSPAMSQPIFGWVVAKATNPQSAAETYYFDTAAGGRIFLHVKNSTLDLYAGTEQSVAGEPTGNWDIVTFVINGAASSLWKNGASLLNGVNCGASVPTKLAVGDNFFAFLGDIAEWGFCNGDPGAIVRRRLEATLGAKYAIIVT